MADPEAGAAPTDPVPTSGVAEAIISIGGQQQGGERSPEVAVVCVGRQVYYWESPKAINFWEILTSAMQAPKKGQKIQKYGLKYNTESGRELPFGGMYI